MINRTFLSALAAASLAHPALAQDATSESGAEAGATAEATAEAEAAPEIDVTPETVVAKIGDHEITMAHVVAVRLQLPQQYAQLPDEVLFSGIVDQLVDQYLLSQVIEADVPRALELRIENERRAILATNVIEDLLRERVTQEVIQEAYDETYANQEPEREYNASHILVPTEEEAAAVVERLEAGEDFATVAQDVSTGPSGPNGGALGWFGTGAMVAPFEEAVVALEPETISGPVQTQFGWHVIRLNETRDAPPPPVEQVAGEIADGLRQEVVGEYVSSLREAASVDIFVEDLPAAALRDDSLLGD